MSEQQQEIPAFIPPHEEHHGEAPAPLTSLPEMHVEMPTIAIPASSEALPTTVSTSDAEQTPQTSVPPQAPEAILPAPPTESATTPPRYDDADRVKARAKKQQIKAEKKKQIVAYVEEHGSIANDIVEQLIDVSDTTAAKYIKELVDEGLLEKRGKGWQTEYVKVVTPLAG